MGRPRSAGRRDLPDNLTPRPRKVSGRLVVYWYWRDPRDGKEKPLQCNDDRATAIRRAKELNALVARELADEVVDSIAASKTKRAAGMPFNAYAVHCLSLWKKRGFAENTLRSRKSLVNAAVRAFADRPLHEIDVPDVVRLLKEYTDQGKNRYAQSLRSTLSDIWTDAKQEGILPADHPSPAAVTRRPDAKVTRARLTLDTFRTILEAAEGLGKSRGAWMPNSQLLALVTAQRREDLAISQFRRGRDWLPAWEAFQEGREHPIHPYPYVEDGHFWVVQQKTGALVSIPLTLRLEAIGLSVGDVIERCRSVVASRYLLHHTTPYGNAPRGTAIHKDTISRGFADAREQTDLSWPGKTPPTFHEIRSLSERLYKAQGVNTQALLGHKHAKMTEVYADPRQAEWGVVSG